jgi:WD40 repeat protein
MEKPMKFKMSIGNISNNIHSLFFPGFSNPNIIINFKEDSIFLWNIKTNSLVASFSKFYKMFKKILKIDISYICKLRIVFIAAAFDSGHIQIWKIDILKTIVASISLCGHTYPVSCVKFSENTSSFVSGCEKGNIIIWNILQEKGEFKIKTAHEGSIKILLFLNIKKNKNQFILSFGSDSLIKIWKLKKNITNKTIFLPEKNISSIIYNIKKNMLILVTTKSQLNFYHISKNFKFYQIGSYWKNDNSFDFEVLLDKKSKFLFLTNKNNQLNIFKFKINNKQNFIKKKENITQKLQNILFKPASFFFQSKIIGIDIWNKSINKKLIILIHNVFHILELYKFSELSIKNKNKFSLKKICKSELEHHNSEVREIKWFKNSYSIVALCGIARTIHIWCINSRRSLDKISTSGHSLCFVLCGKKNLIVGNKIGSLEIYDLLSKKLIWFQENAHKGPVWSIDIAKNDFLVASAGADGILKIWEFEIKQIYLSKILKLKEQILSVRLIPTENVVIICTLVSSISIFFLNNLQFSFNLQGHKLPVISLAIRDDYSLIASGSADTSFGVWNFKHRHQKKIVWTNLSAITAVEFQTHTGNLFTASRCGSVCFWNDVHYELIYQSKQCHSGPIWTLKSSINGKYLASGSYDRSIKIWKIRIIYNKNTEFIKIDTKKIDEKRIFFKKKKINCEIKNKPYLNYIYNYLTLPNRKEKIIQKQNLFLNYFLQLKKNEIIELTNRLCFLNFLNMLKKIIKIASNKNNKYNFEIVERLFFLFKVFSNRFKHKKKIKIFENLKKKLSEIIINIETDNLLIRMGLKAIKNNNWISDLPDSN